MINVAVVGCGGISNMHIQGLLEFKDRIKITALCDIYPQKAEASKEKYGLTDAIVFADHKEMLSAGIPIDVVHVCTPPSSHAEIAINSMRSGRNVLVEKPMAPSLEQCDEMLKAEKENNVVMGIIAQNRFRNVIYKLKKVYDSGLAGDLKVAHINSLWWRGHEYYDLWWRGTWEKEGGGPTLNHAVHHIDMINWFTNELPCEVSSMLANVMHDNSEVEDISFAAVKYKDEKVGIITSSVVHHGEEQGLELQCSDAKIAVPWSVKAEISQPNGFWSDEHNPELIERIEKYYNDIPDLKYEAHTGEIDNYYTALENGERPMITGIDGRRTVELITAIYKAGFEKRTISLPITNDDEYYTENGVLKNAIHFHEKKTSVENFDEGTLSVGNY